LKCGITACVTLAVQVATTAREMPTGQRWLRSLALGRQKRDRGGGEETDEQARDSKSVHRFWNLPP
jgi:hypothetical protein